MSRFSEPQHPVFRQLNASIGFDWRLGPYDVELSRAHARMLAQQQIVAAEDRDELLAALDTVEHELEEGTFPFRPDDEDVHMAIERRVTELAGPVGGKLHTARSRNDQVATDMALFTRAHARAAGDAVRELMRALVGAAERHVDWRMPGYTHLQRAQPVYLSHHLLAYVWMLARDLERFAGVAENSIDAVSNRDFVLDYLAAAATCGTHLSRLGAEIVLWSSSEFGFAEVSDAWASGSSIMPQKKNPDAAELLRAKAPRIAGHFVALQGVLHALPLTYNKDMQEDKEHLFDAVDTLELCLAAATGMIEGIVFDRERMAQAAADELPAATDVADLLVRRGMPFRESHGVVAALVKRAVDSGRTLTELRAEELAEHCELLDEEYYRVLAGESWLESKDSEGGTSLRRVREQLERARALLG